MQCKSICLFVATVFCTSIYSQSSEIVPTSNNGANPYSKGIAQKIVGYVLTGMGAADLVSGILIDANNVFVNAYALPDHSTDDLNRGLQRAIWIGGLVEIGIGVPFIVAGHASHSKWEKWQNDHNLKVSFSGTNLTVQF